MTVLVTAAELQYQGWKASRKPKAKSRKPANFETEQLKAESQPWPDELKAKAKSSIHQFQRQKLKAEAVSNSFPALCRAK